MMWQSFDFLQIQIHSYITNLDSIIYSFYLYFYTLVTYLSTDFLNDVITLKWSSNLFYNWFHPWRLDNLYNLLIADQLAYTWLWNYGNYTEWATWYVYNLFFQSQSNLYYAISSRFITKLSFITLYIGSYYTVYIILFFKYSFFFLLSLNVLFFTKVNLAKLNWLNNIIFAKFFIFFETEEELGSLDDALLFISFFFLLFSWYFLVSFFFLNVFFTSLSFLIVGFLILVFFVLCIPLSVLLNFGLAFSSYIRGAGSSTNLFVEVLFDLIGTLVVFTRFIVQNIRFILIFWAYFELFEWIYSSPALYIVNSLFTLNFEQNYLSNQTSYLFNFFYFVSGISGLIGYIYYFMHLLILLLIQLGAYFLISFWLFFFFYTSFYLTRTEKLFFYKRYL